MITMTKSPMSPPQAIDRASRNGNGNGNAFSKAGLTVGAVVDRRPSAWFAETTTTSSRLAAQGLNASSSSSAPLHHGLQGALTSMAAVSLVILGAVAMCSFSRRRRRTLDDPERQLRPLGLSQQQQQRQLHPLSHYQPTAAQRSSHRATLVLSPNPAQLAAASVARPFATADIAKRQSIDPIYILANQPSPLAISLEAQRATMSPALRMRLSARLTLETADHAVSAATLKGDSKQAFFDQSPDTSESDQVTETACDDDGEIDENDPYARMPASPSTIQSFCSPYIALEMDRSPLVPLATSLALESQVDLARDVSLITLERYEHEGVAEAAEGEVRPIQGLPYMAVMIDRDGHGHVDTRLTAIQVQAQQQQHPLVSSSASSTSSISRSNTNSSAMTITPLVAGIGNYYSHPYDHSSLVPNPYPSPVATDRLRPAPLQLVPMDDAANSSSSTSTLVCKSPAPTVTSTSAIGATSLPNDTEPHSSSSSSTTLSGTSAAPKSPHRSLQQSTLRPIGSGMRRPNRPRPLATPSTLFTNAPSTYSPNSFPLTLPPGLTLTPFPFPSPIHLPPPPPLASARQMYLATAWSHLFTRLHTDCTLLVRKSLSLATTLGDRSAPLPPLTSPAAKKRRARLVSAAATELVGRATAVVQALAAGYAGHAGRASGVEGAGFAALAAAMAGINLGVLAPPPPPPPSASSAAAGVSKVQRDAVSEQVKARLAEDHVLFHGILAHPVLRPIVSALVDKNRLAVVSAPMVAWMAVALVQVQAAVPAAGLVVAQDGECVVPSAEAPAAAGEAALSPYCVRRASGPGAVSAARHSSVQGHPGASGGNGGGMSVDALVRVMYHQGGSLAVDGSAMSLVASASAVSAGAAHVKYIGTLFPGIVDQRSGQVLARCRVVTDVEREGGV